jgi:hypothetical protein
MSEVQGGYLIPAWRPVFRWYVIGMGAVMLMAGVVITLDGIF